MLRNWPRYRILLTVAGIVLGAGAGYLYWYYVGCYSGTCLITSKASHSSLYGAVMGFLLAGTVWDMKNKKSTKHKEQ